jgi:hypothetical protein
MRCDHGSCASQRDFMQADVLNRCPDNGETTGLGREDVDLISTLPDIAEETLDRIGGLNVPVHRLRKGINEVGSQRVTSPIDSEERFSKLVTL